MEDFLHWKQQDDDIRDEVVGTIRIPKSCLIEAGSLDCFIPCVVVWLTLIDGSFDGSKHPGQDEGGDEPALERETISGKDLGVEEEN